MQFVYADFRRRMQFRRHSVASIAPSSKSVPRNFSTGNVFSRGCADMVSILEPLRPPHRTHSSTKQHSKVAPSRPVYSDRLESYYVMLAGSSKMPLWGENQKNIKMTQREKAMHSNSVLCVF